MKPRVVEVKEKKILERAPPDEKEWVFVERHGGKEEGVWEKIKRAFGIGKR